MPESNSPAPAPAPRRDGIQAAIVLAVVAAVVGFGYHRGNPAPAAAPDVREPPAPGVVYAAPDGPAIGGFDMNRAMALAGEQLPPNVESYYFFAFVDEVPAEQEIADLAQKLAQASQEHDFLGIAGADSERNRRNLLSALRANKGVDLGGVVIIYVGPADHREELTQAVQAAGAQFRFVTYPAASDPKKPQV